MKVTKWYIDEVGPDAGRGYSIRLDKNDMRDGDEEVATVPKRVNAKLIAVAPDLLTQLESMAWVVGRMLTDAGGPTAATGGWGENSYYGGVEYRLQKATEAIIKAKDGESKADWEFYHHAQIAEEYEATARPLPVGAWFVFYDAPERIYNVWEKTEEGKRDRKISADFTDHQTAERIAAGWDERPEPTCNCVKCTTARTAAMEPNDYAMCVHCGASHHMDDDHQCEEAE